jgi:DeoR/GlpR family transcriptional regulator of sugar metabolism
MDGRKNGAKNFGPGRRQEEIAEYVTEEGFVSAKYLASVYGVSMMTIYRDFDELQQQGVIRRERGVATPQSSSLFESNIRYRMRNAVEEKDTLCRRAFQEIQIGQAVMFDDSTTLLPLARMLARSGSLRPLTVITNFRIALEEMSAAREMRLLCLGGEYYANHGSYGGVICEAAIRSLRPDLLFVSTSAVSDGAALHQDPETVRTKRAMLSVARRKILLIDHGKLGKSALHHLVPLSDFDLVLVDAGASPSALTELRDSDATYEVV